MIRMARFREQENQSRKSWKTNKWLTDIGYILNGFVGLIRGITSF